MRANSVSRRLSIKMVTCTRAKSTIKMDAERGEALWSGRIRALMKATGEKTNQMEQAGWNMQTKVFMKEIGLKENTKAWECSHLLRVLFTRGTS